MRCRFININMQSLYQHNRSLFYCGFTYENISCSSFITSSFLYLLNPILLPSDSCSLQLRDWANFEGIFQSPSRWQGQRIILEEGNLQSYCQNGRICPRLFQVSNLPRATWIGTAWGLDSSRDFLVHLEIARYQFASSILGNGDGSLLEIQR